MCFCCFYGFICYFLEYPMVKTSKIFTAHRTQRDTNFKQEKSRVCRGSFFDFLKFVFWRCLNTGLTHFPGKRALTKLQYLLTVCKILQNFTEGNSKKFTVSFALCAHIDVIKYRKHWRFPLSARRLLELSSPGQTMGSHLKYTWAHYLTDTEVTMSTNLG